MEVYSWWQKEEGEKFVVRGKMAKVVERLFGQGLVRA